MICRALQSRVEEALGQVPAVAILGPRQVGKTTLARAIAGTMGDRAVVLDLERAADLAKLTDPELFLDVHRERLVILDEIQRRPDLFPCLRVLIDRDRRPGRFLILGSASPALLRQSNETLAGRIRYLELAPFHLAEVSGCGGMSANSAQARLWLRGGFPESYLVPSDDAAFAWLDAFLGTFLTRDIPGLGSRVAAEQLRRFLSMVAHCHGQLWNGAPIASSLGVSAPTVRHYLDLMTECFIVRVLPPYHSNLKRRVIKSPKVYLRDTGLLHRLLGAETRDDLLGRAQAGASWEGFVVEQVIRQAPLRTEFFFYRSSGGAEIDLLVRGPRQKGLTAVEVKLSLAPKPERGFWQAFADLGCTRGFVVYPGTERYALRDNVRVIPVADVAEALR
jgi:hypothetical protein